jgi:hypothetical protein
MTGTDEQREPVAWLTDGSTGDRAAVSLAVARLLVSDRSCHIGDHTDVGQIGGRDSRLTLAFICQRPASARSRGHGCDHPNNRTCFRVGTRLPGSGGPPRLARMAPPWAPRSFEPISAWGLL